MRTGGAYRPFLGENSDEPPLIGFLLIVQMANARYVRRMAVPFSPVDCLLLRFECCQHVIRVVFNDEICDRLSFSFTLRPCFDEHVGH